MLKLFGFVIPSIQITIQILPLPSLRVSRFKPKPFKPTCVGVEEVKPETDKKNGNTKWAKLMLEKGKAICLPEVNDLYFTLLADEGIIVSHSISKGTKSTQYWDMFWNTSNHIMLWQIYEPRPKKDDWVGIPKKFKWKAQDVTGDWHGYISKPVDGESFWDDCPNEVHFVSDGDPNPYWRETLTRRPK